MTLPLTDLKPVTRSFLEDVLSGLSQERKTLNCKYLYDKSGVGYFNQICNLKEYYITRLESTMLEANSAEICTHIPNASHIVEYGSGSSDKIRFLFDQPNKVTAYTAIDISMTYLKKACEQLGDAYPHINVEGICGDYLSGDLPITNHPGQSRVVFFPGSTLGNLDGTSLNQLLEHSRSHVGSRGWFFLGVDLVKPVDVLLAAYDDSEGVTAAFNLNLLTRINRELGGNFDVSAFHHEARWNEDKSRIEMHIVSKKDQMVTIEGTDISFSESETIFTESSHKYTPDTITERFRTHGYTLKKQWHDPKKWFGHFLFQLDS